MSIGRFIENTAVLGFSGVGAEVVYNSVNQLGLIPPDQHLVAVGLGTLIIAGVMRAGVDYLRRPALPPEVKGTAGKNFGEVVQPLSVRHGDVVDSSLQRLAGNQTINPITGKRTTPGS